MARSPGCGCLTAALIVAASRTVSELSIVAPSTLATSGEPSLVKATRWAPPGSSHVAPDDACRHQLPAAALENARLLGGGSDTRSEIGAGSLFTLRLPVAKPLHGGAGADTGASDDVTQ